MLIFAGMASALTTTAGVFSVSVTGPQETTAQALSKGSDFGLIRRQALVEHPIGSQIGDVAKAFEALGFSCKFRPHVIDNITAPTVVCRSHALGKSVMPRLDVVLVARNGALTDIAVSNGLDGVEASAETPDPNPGGMMSAPAAVAPLPDPEWDAILAEARQRYPAAPGRFVP